MNASKLYDYGAMPIHVGAAVVCAALLGLGYVFGLSPLMSESDQSTTVIEQAEQAEFDAKKVKGELDQLTKELESVEQALAAQPVSLKSAGQINTLLVDLAGWSEQHQLAVTKTHAGKRQTLTYYDYVPIELNGEGSFADLMAFLKHLHKQRGDLGVIGFVVNRQASGSGVNFGIELAWYVLSDDIQVGPGTGAQPTAVVPTVNGF